MYFVFSDLLDSSAFAVLLARRNYFAANCCSVLRVLVFWHFLATTTNNDVSSFKTDLIVFQQSG